MFRIEQDGQRWVGAGTVVELPGDRKGIVTAKHIVPSRCEDIEVHFDADHGTGIRAEAGRISRVGVLGEPDAALAIPDVDTQRRLSDHDTADVQDEIDPQGETLFYAGYSPTPEGERKVEEPAITAAVGVGKHTDRPDRVTAWTDLRRYDVQRNEYGTPGPAPGDSGGTTVNQDGEYIGPLGESPIMAGMTIPTSTNVLENNHRVDLSSQHDRIPTAVTTAVTSEDISRMDRNARQAPICTYT